MSCCGTKHHSPVWQRSIPKFTVRIHICTRIYEELLVSIKERRRDKAKKKCLPAQKHPAVGPWGQHVLSSLFICGSMQFPYTWKCAMDFHHRSFLTLCHYYYYHHIVIGPFTFILSCAGMCPKTYLTIYVMVKTTQSAFVRWYRHIWTSFNTNDSKSPFEEKFHGKRKKKVTQTHANIEGWYV